MKYWVLAKMQPKSAPNANPHWQISLHAQSGVFHSWTGWQ